jgi:hypothetical protein
MTLKTEAENYKVGFYLSINNVDFGGEKNIDI